MTDTSLTLFTGLDDSEEEISRLKDMRGMVEEFHQHMLQTATDLKAMHIKEFLHLRKLRNDDGKDDKSHNNLSADIQAFLRSRLGPPPAPRSYSVNSNAGETSFEPYFDDVHLD